MQIFRKHAKFTLFLQKTMLQRVILLRNMHSISECLLLFWSGGFHPLLIYPIVFQHPVLPVVGNQHIAAMESSKRTVSEITDSAPTWKAMASIQKDLWPEAHYNKDKSISWLIVLVPVACPQSGNPCVHDVHEDQMLIFCMNSHFIGKVCHTVHQTDSPAPYSHHWSSNCLELSKIPKQTMPQYTFHRNQPSNAYRMG